MNFYKIYFYIILALLSSSHLISQETATISGVIKDDSNGELLIGATIFNKGTGNGIATNAYGFYSLEVKTDTLTELRISFIGLETIDTILSIRQDTKINFSLKSSGIIIDEVVVTSNSIKENIASPQTSMEMITSAQAKILPALLGEVDIIKTMQLKPGISSGSEGSSNLYVRGGNGDQNLIILDEATVYNANHLFGFFSTFNVDGVKDARIFKGGFPAQYGGRLSSVIDVHMRDGNKKQFSGSGGIGLITSRLTLEGPIKEDKISYIVSGRRTYVDIITNAINKTQEDNPDFNNIPAYNFYDLNAKVNAKISEKDHLYISGYFGRDVFSFNDDDFDFNFNWGNATGTIRWNHQYSSKLFSNTSAIFSDYQYTISNDLTGFSFNLNSSIQDVSLKQDFYWFPNPRHQIKFGLHFTSHRFGVGRLKAGSDDGLVAFSGGEELDALDYALYFNDEFELGKNLKGTVGLRASFFTNEDTYTNLEPRLALNYLINADLSIKASYARMSQYVHLVANSGLSLPTDIWYPSTDNVKPQLSDQYVLGYQWSPLRNFIFTNEFYYKRMYNQIQFRDHAQLFANPNLEDEFVFGDGEAFGAEFGLERTKGILRGWVGYTLAKVNLFGFEDILDGQSFSPKYDRRHDLTLVLIYEMSQKWHFTGTYVYGSGEVAWLPTGKFVFQDFKEGTASGVVPYYQDRNNIRSPYFSRLDLGAVYHFQWKTWDCDLTFSIINALNRRNPYFLYLDVTTEKVDNGQKIIEVPVGVAAKQVSLIPIIPSVTWNFKF